MNTPPVPPALSDRLGSLGGAGGAGGAAGGAAGSTSHQHQRRPRCDLPALARFLINPNCARCNAGFDLPSRPSRRESETETIAQAICTAPAARMSAAATARPVLLAVRARSGHQTSRLRLLRWAVVEGEGALGTRQQSCGARRPPKRLDVPSAQAPPNSPGGASQTGPAGGRAEEAPKAARKTDGTSRHPPRRSPKFGPARDDSPQAQHVCLFACPRAGAPALRL